MLLKFIVIITIILLLLTGPIVVFNLVLKGSYNRYKFSLNGSSDKLRAELSAEIVNKGNWGFIPRLNANFNEDLKSFNYLLENYIGVVSDTSTTYVFIKSIESASSPDRSIKFTVNDEINDVLNYYKRNLGKGVVLENQPEVRLEGNYRVALLEIYDKKANHYPLRIYLSSKTDKNDTEVVVSN